MSHNASGSRLGCRCIIGGAAPPETQYKNAQNRRLARRRKGMHCGEKLSHLPTQCGLVCSLVCSSSSNAQCKTRYPTLLVGQCNDVRGESRGGKVRKQEGESLPPSQSHLNPASPRARRICPRYLGSTILPIVAPALFPACIWLMILKLTELQCLAKRMQMLTLTLVAVSMWMFFC